MRRFPDHYARKAKAEGKAARSIFKLEEIDQRWHILRAGNHVLDLGCAPGSWMQYAAEKVGPRGSVLGIDLQPLQIGLPPWVEARVGDAFQTDWQESFDVVLSDMAPSTTGQRATDQARSMALAERALEVATRALRRGGHVVIKVLEGGDVPQLVATMRKRFERVELLRPQATRKVSTEIFVVGLRSCLPAASPAEGLT